MPVYLYKIENYIKILLLLFILLFILMLILLHFGVEGKYVD